FCHEDADAEVDAENVGIVPLGVGRECIAEAVSSPSVFGVAILERVENVQAWAGKKRQRAGGGAGDDRAVDPSKTAFAAAATARTSPGRVSVLRVGCGDAPVVEGVGFSEREAEGLVGSGGEAGVGEVVGV